MSKTRRYEPIDAAACRALAGSLGDTPETAISVHLLRRGLCKAYVAGSAGDPRAAIVQSDFCTTEPVGFGSDPDLLWELLGSVEGWDCFLVDTPCSERIAELIGEETGRPARFVQDIYHVLEGPAPRFELEAVRLLTPDDAPLLESELRGTGYVSQSEMLAQGVAAGAIVDGRIVSLAHTSARSERYADIGVDTLEAFRRRGFARAAAALVAERIRQEGQTPVWSTGDHNVASLALARQLGFVEVSRRTYVVAEK